MRTNVMAESAQNKPHVAVFEFQLLCPKYSCPNMPHSNAASPKESARVLLNVRQARQHVQRNVTSEEEDWSSSYRVAVHAQQLHALLEARKCQRLHVLGGHKGFGSARVCPEALLEHERHLGVGLAQWLARRSLCRT